MNPLIEIPLGYADGRPAVGGSCVTRLIKNKYNMAALRPWVDQDDGKSYLTINNEAQLLNNDQGLLGIREWILMDEAVMRVARLRLRFWNDLIAAGATVNIPNAMRYSVYQYQRTTDAGSASMSMDGRRRGPTDRTATDLDGVPLPIIHADFDIPMRDLELSLNGILPFDTTMAEQAMHKIAVLIEEMALGLINPYQYAGFNIYGTSNFPARIATGCTLPTTPGWTPKLFVNELIAARQLLQNKKKFGPFAVYVAKAWDQYLDEDYKDTYGGETLRTRIGKVARLSEPQTSDYLPNFDINIVHLDGNTIRAVQGLKPTTVQWSEDGGFGISYKIFCIMVSQMRDDTDGNTGIAHLVAS